MSGGPVEPPGRYRAGPMTPTSVDIDRQRAVTVRFEDGAECTFGLVELRQACPCATCRAYRDQGEPSWPRPGQPTELTIVDAAFVGAWGISFTWSDGHATGIYPWDALRSWCEAAHPSGDDPAPVP